MNTAIAYQQQHCNNKSIATVKDIFLILTSLHSKYYNYSLAKTSQQQHRNCYKYLLNNNITPTLTTLQIQQQPINSSNNITTTTTTQLQNVFFWN